ncbi:GH36-type glycosyl hydrolase domain-containing protein [Tepidibacillus decaturensis]|uniref:Cellobiose phosphorylase n=1 Tax=Tepidibacillus decaturensis TaxID=1413211 RepID=A0A135L139_9BACI|nr:amylo-alpha-1,6-glucosidase [Tepidibacillus decaturensis]KXG42710.1 cellobiose phosphorylase [Tepidibacillus decaturensis]
MTIMTDSKFVIEAEDLQFTFLNSGDIYEVMHKGIMLNQWIANPIDGSLNNLYLRLHRKSELKVIPLLGVRSASKLGFSKSQVFWKGNIEQIQYQVVFTLTEKGIWFWDIKVNGYNEEIDIIYGQDLGLADKGAVRTNEAYVSQYIDHKVFEDDHKGYVICSRQNQPQLGTFPYIQQGSLTKSIGYSTDGFQFFGLSYKETNEPEVLTKELLANEIYQYEFAYTALQSKRIKLQGNARFVFYGLFKEDHPTAIRSLEFETEILDAWKQVNNQNLTSVHFLDKVNVSPIIGLPLKTLSMTKEEIDIYFPYRHHEEWDEDKLLSFFTNKHEHVVLKEKELIVERPHGHIIMTGQKAKKSENIITSTSYMYGVFNSQLVVGNTAFNKMLTNTRNALNILKTSGQRIYVEFDGVYHLLTMPSMYELGFNYSRWYYKTNDDLLIITNFTTVDTPEVQLHVRSISGKSYRFLVTHQISMNNNEYEAPFRIKKDSQTISFYADTKSDSAKTYPDLCYRLHVTGSTMTVEDEQMLASNILPRSASLVVLELSATSEWAITIQGLLYNEEIPFVKREAKLEIEHYRAFYRTVMNEFHLSRNGTITEELDKINAIAWWYTHNMLVHFSVPHGLEQYGGAAWGTRDVCQGPTEYFLATQKHDTVRDIIRTVYSHQYEDDGNWPQWFMFDKYYTIQLEVSHGDIIVWPLKVLSDYLTVTKDFDILEEKVPYTIRGSFTYTEKPATIFEHVKKQIAYMKQHFLHDTYLSSYGDGDWDDTLQPANAQLKQYMVSSWTVALTYQTLKQFSDVLKEVSKLESKELQTLVSGIESDFNRYILQSGVIPGFIYMEQPEKAELLLHPSDSKTGIHYRLLPMTRSIISELLTPEQAEKHYQVIKEKLYFPDGVRLMDRPAKYNGGVSIHFKRAEQAANFGREIGLQYVHAHIRFVEAMAKLGKAEEVWNGLAMINPIGIQQVVPNAERRQSNTYFSSSDGKFNTRYEAQERFHELREGEIPVKGGWRIYSSGPGIYMNQLISNVLGIRLNAGDLIIDPVLPNSLDGIQFNFSIMDYPATFIYHLKGNKVKRVLVNGLEATTNALSNRYRNSGVRINQQELKHRLKNDKNIFEIFKE